MGTRVRGSFVVLVVVALFATPTAGIQLAEAAKPRNVVVILTDDQVYESANGPYSVMDNLNASPYGHWVNFSNAFVNASICCPSRSTILTGQDSYHTGVTKNSQGENLDADETMATWLDRAGYRTAMYGKYLNDWPWKGAENPPPGWDDFRTGGKSHVVTGRALDFIQDVDEPFFLFLSYLAPHMKAKRKTLDEHMNANVPIIPDPPNFDEADVSDKPQWVRNQGRLSNKDLDLIREERLWSQRSLLGVDQGVQQVMDELDRRGHLDDTLVIFLSDNGFSFGSHRHVKKHCVYEECHHIPMYVRHPDAPGNRVEDRLVSNLDIASTVAEFTGVPTGIPQDGVSLVPLLTDTARSWREEVLLERRGGGSNKRYWAVRSETHKYVEYDNGDRELYDLVADPYELENVVDDHRYRATRDDLDARLDAIRPD